MAIYTKNLADEFYTKCFISGLKEAIQAHVQGNHPPNWMEACHQDLHAEVIINSQNPRSTFTTKRKPVPSGNQVPPLNIQRLSPEEMANRQCKGLCYNYDETYVKGHRFHEQKCFHIDVNTTPEIEEMGLEEPSREEINGQPLLVPNTVELAASTEEAIISLHALSGVSTPQNLKIKGYNKYHQLVVLIYSGSTHNFINRSKAQSLHIFVHSTNNFQVLIANGGTMKCDVRYENVKLQMGDYHL